MSALFLPRRCSRDTPQPTPRRLGIPKEFPRGSFDLGGLERRHSVSAPEQPWQTCQGDLREVWEKPSEWIFLWVLLSLLAPTSCA